MAVSFYIQSNNKKDIAPIWVRYTDNLSDAKTRTPLYIENGRLEKGKIKKFKTNKSLSTNERQLIKEKNLSLDIVEQSMRKIERLIVDAINELPQRNKIKSDWLKKVVNQTNELVLKDHIQNWLDSRLTKKENTKEKYKVFKNFMETYTNTDILLSDIDFDYFEKLKAYCFDIQKDEYKIDWRFKSTIKEKTYRPRSINGRVTYLKAVCNYAEDNGYKLKFNPKKVKRLKEYKAIKSYITIDELKKIQDLDIKIAKVRGNKVSLKELQIARDWLVISCLTAMRSIDMYDISNTNIIDNNIVFKQEKTDSNDVAVPITPPIKTILNRYNGFPPIDKSKTFKAWKQQYGRHIKLVCKKAGMNEMVSSMKGNKKIKTEKYNTINAHIGRMSFATNSYGKVPTSVLTKITGHKSERQLLTYINKDSVIQYENLHDKLGEIFKL